METIVDNYSAAIIFLVFCLGIIFEHRRGYREGVRIGYVGGTGETIRYLMESGVFTATLINKETNTEEPATYETLSAYILAKTVGKDVNIEINNIDR